MCLQLADQGEWKSLERQGGKGIRLAALSKKNKKGTREQKKNRERTRKELIT